MFTTFGKKYKHRSCRTDVYEWNNVGRLQEFVDDSKKKKKNKREYVCARIKLITASIPEIRLLRFDVLYRVDTKKLQ